MSCWALQLPDSDLIQGAHMQDKKAESQTESIRLLLPGTCNDQKALLTCVLELKAVLRDDGPLNIITPVLWDRFF